MSKSSKIKINFTTNYNGKVFTFKNVTVAKSSSGWGWAPMSGTSSVIRQFVKQMWPELNFRISSSTYSGGDSVTIYLQTPVSDEKYKEIRDVLKGFQSGTFNGMIDSYEYKEKSGITATVDGVSYNFDTRYMNVENRPKWGTTEYDSYWASQK
jgi:hypothetical protein